MAGYREQQGIARLNLSHADMRKQSRAKNGGGEADASRLTCSIEFGRV